MGFFDDDEDDFWEMMDDIWLLNEIEREKQCKKKCPDYKSCRASFSKCKYAKKKKKRRLFF